MFLKAIAWLVPGGSIVSTLATAAGAVLKFLGALIKTATQGATKMLANPATFVTAGLCVLVAFGVGIRLGVKWDAHLVRKIDKQLQQVTAERDAARYLNTQWQGRLNAQETKAQHALMAREKAESDTRLRLEKAEAQARAARARLTRAERLRDGSGQGSRPAKAGPKDAAGSGLQGLQALFGLGQ